MPVVRTYRPDERPDVEVLVDSLWCAELRQWSVDDDANWFGQVSWRREIWHTDINVPDRPHPDGTKPIARSASADSNIE